MTTLTVGGLYVPYDSAERWAREYLIENLGRLIRIGMPGPLNRSQPPRPQQGRYLSLLTDEDGRKLLSELSVEVPLTNDGFFGRPNNYWDGDEIDSLIIAKLRNEQSKLRKALLDGRHQAPCAMCGRVLPKLMLIAGHIKPRSHCSEGRTEKL